ncbi:MAG: oligopeptide/dipeptide ABC transporter ATP-binding protein [Comamonadaceae bacterium]|jgi:peptide/nickel transport system ATP-binding protein
MSETLLQLDHVTRSYTLPRERLWGPAPQVHAVRGVSLRMHSGCNLGVVGESGSGKSTLARLVMGLEAPSSGSVQMLGQDLNQLGAAALREARRNFQMVFQDPYGSLDPRQTVQRIVTEPLAALGGADAMEQQRRAQDVLGAVGLRSSDLSKYPHEFSGGQRQRVAIARALITRPRLIVADEPVSALDVSVQAQVLNLMQDLSQQFGVTYLLISHDLAVVDYLCDEVAVIYQGRIVEQGSPLTLFKGAAHPYTQALLQAVPRVSTLSPRGARKRAALSVANPQGADACPYAARCPQAQALCAQQRPELQSLAQGHQVACHFATARTPDS